MGWVTTCSGFARAAWTCDLNGGRLRVGKLGAPRIPGLAKGLCAGAMADPEHRGEIVALHRLGDLRPVSVALVPLLVEVVLARDVGRRGALLLQLDFNHVEVLGARAERGRQNCDPQRSSHSGPPWPGAEV